MLEIFAHYAFYLFAYSFFGWVMEVGLEALQNRTFVNRGFVFGPFCPIYGFGALAVIVLLRPMLDNPLAVFVLGALVASAIEYISHWLLQKVLGLTLWDYSRRMFNLHGRVCLLNSLGFGLLTLLALYMLQPVLKSVANNTPTWPLALCMFVLCGWLLTDVISSVLAAWRLPRAKVGRSRHLVRRAKRLHNLQTKQ